MLLLKCQSKVILLLFAAEWSVSECSELLSVVGAGRGGPPVVRGHSLFHSQFAKSLILNSPPPGWSGWRSSSRARGSECTPTCWRGSACGTLRRVFASSGLATTSGGSCLIPTPRVSTTTTPPPSAQCGTAPRAATSSPWPSCKLWSSTPMPPTPVLQEEEGERQLTTAQDVTAGSAEREAPPPPSIRSFLKNKATERRQTGKTAGHLMSHLTGTGKQKPAQQYISDINNLTHLCFLCKCKLVKTTDWNCLKK